MRENELKTLANTGIDITLIFRPVFHQGKASEGSSGLVAYELIVEPKGSGEGLLMTAQNEPRRFRNLSKGLAFVEEIFPKLANVLVLTKEGARINETKRQ